jgi:protein TonB
MKKILLLLFVLASAQFACAQDSEIPTEEIIYKDSVVDAQPQFPGGIENFYKYFETKFKKPEARGMVDKVVLSFIVEKDGMLTDIRIIHDAGFGTADQAINIVEQGPKWTPGSKDGKAVRVFHLLPIAIVTEE